MISIRSLTTDDAGILSEIGGVSLLESHGHSAPMETMQDYVNRSFSEEACYKELADTKNIFYLVTFNDQPAGYYKIILSSPYANAPVKEVTKLERLYLLRKFYGLSLGEKLMTHAMEVSKSGHDKGMWLNVWKENERAIRFYKKLGFQTVGESQFVLTASHSNPNWVLWLPY